MCPFCGEPATLLCDFILGFEIIGWKECNGQAAHNAGRLEEYVPGKGLPYTGSGGDCFTCDAPICEGCARHLGWKFFDGDKKHTVIESTDICPLHRDRSDMAFNKSPVITAEQAERIRRQTWQKPQLRVAGTRT